MLYWEDKKMPLQDIQLILTIALKKEIPIQWFQSHGIPVCSIDTIKSDEIKELKDAQRGMLVLITGPGLEASKKASLWIKDNLNPLFVINIGTCGLINRNHPLGTWLIPRYVLNEKGERLELDTRLPIPYPERVLKIHSLLSAKKPLLGDIPKDWRGYDAVDMECFAQARIFSGGNTSFHCLKFGTDYSDQKALSDFNKNLKVFLQNIKKLFNFIEMDEIKITVIVPVYNRQHTIKRTIDSILSQSYKAEEIIVVDDGSTDGTGEILKGYGDRITCLHLPQNSGPSRARNLGIKHARTEWIAFMDSDDCWDRDKLKRQVEYLKKYPFYEIMQSEEIWIRKGVRVNPCKHHKKPIGWIWEQSLERCLVSPSGVLVKKALLEQYGMFDESLPACEDYDLWLKISRNHPVGLEPSFSVIKYGGHEDQLSRKYPAMDRFRVKTLFSMLRAEELPHFREKIKPVLEKKLNILIKGYEKRQKLKDAEECREILNSLGKY